MSETSSPAPIDTRKTHKKQSLWQIWTPLVLAVLIVLFLATLTVIYTSRDVSGNFNTKWSSISVVFLALPALFISLIALIILVALIYLLSKVFHYIPEYSKKLIDFLLRIQISLHQTSEKISKPVIVAKSNWSGFKAIFNKRSEADHPTS